MLHATFFNCWASIAAASETNALSVDLPFKLVAMTFPLWGLLTIVRPWFRRQPLRVPVVARRGPAR